MTTTAKRSRGKYQKAGELAGSRYVTYLEPSLLKRLQQQARFKGMSLSAIGASLLAAALAKCD